MNKELLQRKFEQLEASRLKILTDLGKADQKILLKKPAPDKWSIAQILYHLNLSEARSLAYVNKKMLGADDLKRTGIVAVVRSTYLKWLLLSGYKFEAPKILGDVPGEVRYDEVIFSWDETRSNLRRFIETIPADVSEKEIYRHPRAGRLNAMQMMDFFQDHFDHHLRQINRLRENGSA